MPKFNRNKPYGTVYGEPGVAFNQDGCHYAFV